MTDEERLTPIRRILVALDVSEPSLKALAEACALAELLDAELTGLFIEDINLLRLAGLPFAQEVSAILAGARRLVAGDMERALRAQASRAQRALAEQAGRRQVRWSFRVMRGQVAAQMLEAALETDLLALGLAAVEVARRAPLGATVREVVRGATRPVLLLPPGAGPRPPVLVDYAGGARAARALDLARYLAQESDGGLVVLISAADPKEAKRLEQEAADRAAPGTELRFRRIGTDSASLSRAVRAEAAGTLVLAGREARAHEELIPKLLEDNRCAVLLVP
ncbi:MAG: hypothetical protein A2151_00720 [Candidatus Muproteobacteria bacterium RBG_16_65_34]|uniref:UspA domain-containing protein n=1 Tax=Candidatus Muproteobacteria bacterium RBG_16_65_34 TaxID=1817760 RepID=A0A1F6TNC4_9PROT|nr:MAG: hypothetical protein A2151_00720 [Candidatus Muproteobacteria bacterium RBG_16_65_34]